MFCIFFSIEGIVARIVVPKGQTVNARYYSNTILPSVFSNWKVIMNKKTVRTLMTHHDNASSHKAKIVTEFLEENKVTVLPHPPYSPDLAPCDFFLFPKIKKELGGKKFDKVENLARSIQSIADNIPKEEYYKSFQEWQRRLKRCIDANGNYFEGME